MKHFQNSLVFCALLLGACGNDGSSGSPGLVLAGAKAVGSVSEEAEKEDTETLALQETGYTVKFLKPTLLKAAPEQGNQLPADKKCAVRAGLHLALRERPTVVNSHWFVKIKGNPEGCSFSEGYVYEQHAVIPEMSIPNYMSPIPGAEVTSSWCACRNIGTSPHIGLDLAKVGIMNSYALSGSFVQSVVFNGGCGWEVTLRDDGGAVWLYRHLNRPAVERGQKLKMGDFVGLHRDFPDSSCGSGAHLHLERLTAGAFGDQSLGRTCQYGYTSCNYNPKVPFKETAAVAKASDASPLQTEAWASLPELRTLGESPEKVLSCQPFQTQPVATSLQWERDFFQVEREGTSKGSGGSESARSPVLVGDVKVISGGSEPPVMSWEMAVQVGGLQNRANHCASVSGLASGALPCIISYEVYVEGNEGSLLRVASEQNSRNRPIVLSQDSRFCLEIPSSGRYALRAQLNSGKTVVTTGRLLKTGR